MSPGMTVLVGFISLAAIYGIVGLSLAIKRVPPAHARNVERLPLTYARWETEDSKKRTLGPGWHLVFPGRDKVSRPIDLREQQVSLEGLLFLTADGAIVTVDAELSFQVTHPLAAFLVGDQNQAVIKLVPMLLGQIIGGMNLEHTQASVDQVTAELRERLAGASDTLGIQLRSANVPSILPATKTGTDGPARQVPPGLGPGQDALSELLLRRAEETLQRVQYRRRHARHSD
jgi:regulator of protease activity HflC (stomatin/prohibitin superfamily)